MGDIIPQAKKMNSKKSSNSKIFSADQAFYYIHVTLYHNYLHVQKTFSVVQGDRKSTIYFHFVSDSIFDTYICL